MRTRRLIASFCLLALAATATVQTPEQYFGFRIGSDKKLVRWDKIVEYLQALANGTDRVKFRNTNLKFVGEYAHNTAVLVWSGEEEHFSFRSDPHTSGFAEIGHYYRPPGRPCAQQPWLASVWRKA